MMLVRCACLIDLRGDKLMLVRVRENEHWYLPGGKIEANESAEVALQRELQEELGISVLHDSIRYLCSVVGPAYAQPGDVELLCFSARWSGEPRALGEISEVDWIDHRQTQLLAPAVQMLCSTHLGALQSANRLAAE
jgi:8-oxo-dGTP diphosphatase